MAVINGATPTAGELPSPRPRPRYRRWLVPAVVVVAGSTAAAGWTALRPDPKTTTAVTCRDSVVNASSGDPVADCTELWRREHGTEAPPLVAWVSGGGGIKVIPEGQDPGKGFKALARSFRQDTAMIELDRELGDVSRALAAGCRSEADARALVDTQLARLGMSGWTTTVRAPDPGAVVRDVRGRAVDEPPPCPAGATVYTQIDHPEDHQIELAPGLHALQPEGAPYTTLAHRLTELLVEGPEARCLPVDQAADIARQEASRLGFSEVDRGIVFHIVAATDPKVATCARPTTDVAGTVEVTVRAVPR